MLENELLKSSKKEELFDQLLHKIDFKFDEGNEERRQSMRKIFTFYPEEGPLRRELYVPHLKFFEAGAKYRERAFMAANRVGKTEGVGGYELTCHLTGIYPAWWKGRTFKKPINAWASGTTAETTRDILQLKLMGPLTSIGTGMIPGEKIIDYKMAPGVPDAIGTVTVKHISGGISSLAFKAYKQGRKAFEGTEQAVILLDEEPPLDIYTECLIRTMTVNGIIMLGFTPLEGLSEVVLFYLPGGQIPDQQVERFIVGATWDDAPHLSAEVKAELWASLPPNQRDARSKGIPALGSGAIYPIDEKDILVDPFQFPNYWPRCGALDPGWNATAALWGALDRDHDIWYLYSEYKRGQAEPLVHAGAIKSRGDWIPFVGDPASRASSQKDGEKLLQIYRSLGIRLNLADNAVEAGLFDVYNRMTTGKLKVFNTLVQWLAEFRIYRRDEKGNVVKANDHLMDDTRYLIRSGRQYAKTMPLDLFAAELGNGYLQRIDNEGEEGDNCFPVPVIC
jgi:phage terminase large subunit-like protein